MSALILIAIILTSVGSGLLGAVMLVSTEVLNLKSKKDPCIMGISGAILIVLAIILSILIPTSCKNRLTKNAYYVTTLDDKITIYQDCDTGEYFRLRDSDWNLLNPHYRQYIDTEEAEDLIAAINYINRWNDKYD